MGDLSKAERKLGKSAVDRLRRTWHNPLIEILQLSLNVLRSWRDGDMSDEEMEEQLVALGFDQRQARPWVRSVPE